MVASKNQSNGSARVYRSRAHTLCAITVLLSLGALGADTFLFRDGQVRNGRVLSQTRTTVTVRIDGVVRTLSKGSLRTIKFNRTYDSAPTAAARKPVAALTKPLAETRSSTSPPRNRAGQSSLDSSAILFSLVPGWAQWRQGRTWTGAGLGLGFVVLGANSQATAGAFRSGRHRYNDAVVGYVLASPRTAFALGATSTAGAEAMFVVQSRSVAHARHMLDISSGRAKSATAAWGVLYVSSILDALLSDSGRSRAAMVLPQPGGLQAAFSMRF